MRLQQEVYLLTLLVAGVMLTATFSAKAVQQPNATIPDMSGKILTVTGPIDASELGPTIMHEHIFIDYTGAGRLERISAATDLGLYYEPVSLKNLSAIRAGLVMNRDNLLLTDIDLAIQEVLHFKRWGGKSIADVTSIGLGRDPKALVQVANATGLNIVMGAGYYVKSFHPPDMDERTVEELTQVIIRDVTVGAEGTNIRSGIIGEVGIGGNPLTANEMKSIRASARASRATGAAISFHHAGYGEEKFTVLDAVASEGADLNRVIIGHANHIATDLAFIKRLLERGVYIQFDLLGEVIPRLGRVHDAEVVAAITQLIQAGYADRLLLSQDVCTKAQLKAYGGMGYSYVMEFVLPELRRLGVTDDQIEKIMVENPRRVLTFAPPAPLKDRNDKRAKEQ